MVTGSIPAVMEMAAHVEPFVLVEPSSTPFLPARDTATAMPTDLPTATWSPTATETMPATIPWTETTTATQTMVILPSVTAASPLVYPTQVKPTKMPQILPTVTLKPKAYNPPAATDPAVIVIVMTETPIVFPTEDPSTWTPTATFSGSETATPLPSATSQPTATTIPSATRTATPNPSNPFPGCAYSLNASFESQIFDRINQARAEAGLWSLSWYAPLASGAQYHSIDMGCNKYFAHTGGVYENILAGYNTVEEAWNWWWNSKPHHDNILGQYYYKVGVGYASVPGSPYRYYWTIQFSR